MSNSVLSLLKNKKLSLFEDIQNYTLANNTEDHLGSENSSFGVETVAHNQNAIPVRRSMRVASISHFEADASLKSSFNSSKKRVNQGKSLLSLTKTTQVRQITENTNSKRKLLESDEDEVVEKAKKIFDNLGESNNDDNYHIKPKKSRLGLQSIKNSRTKKASTKKSSQDLIYTKPSTGNIRISSNSSIRCFSSNKLLRPSNMNFTSSKFNMKSSTPSLNQLNNQDEISSKDNNNIYSNENTTNNPVNTSVITNPFSRSDKHMIVGREEEKGIIQTKIDLLADEKKVGGSLYISGNPGTGKTACVLDVLDLNKDLLEKSSISVTVINCMLITTAKQLYTLIFDKLYSQNPDMKDSLTSFDDFDTIMNAENNSNNNREVLQSTITETEFIIKSKLENMFIKKDTKYTKKTSSRSDENIAKKMKKVAITKNNNQTIKNEKQHGYIIVLDELDNLIKLNTNILYSFFEWSSNPNSCLFLIGIANALDLTERLLPRLKARNCIPELLHFKPYNVNEILMVLKQRSNFLEKNASNDSNQKTVNFTNINALSTKTSIPEIQNPALELCARKVAAASGDMRKALDACRLAVEGTKSKSTTAGKPGMGLTATGSNKVTIGDMMKVLSTLYGTSTDKLISGLNFHQKAVLAGLLRHNKFTKEQLGQNQEKQNYKYEYNNMNGFDSDEFGSQQDMINKKMKQKPVLGLGGFSKAKSKTIPPLSLNNLYKLYIEICNDARLPSYLARSEFNDIVSMMESIGVVSIAQPSSVSSSQSAFAISNALSGGKGGSRSVSCNFNSSRLLSSTKSFVANGENCVMLSISTNDAQKALKDLSILSNLL
ncbi:hypothetical protein BB559_003406 [Furculomyces boomerangus]|uniref:AAA lid domain-containing protein n=2 Tax=Harpellales TaxID=61421 RepID=A0A2T9YLF4_9FUNG|nr:hypothetical protein BB559_003406 [Furculomyces boomerangus]PVZ99464.1 hypothetical protein BB558_004412 [Smittium angustum]